MTDKAAKPRGAVMAGLAGVPRTVWALGFVSMFMDVSSEMVHSLLPVFLVSSLGASPALVGLIEGVAEATASVTKLFSGWLSDRLGKRKMLAVLGYGMAAATKPVFPLAVTPMEVLGARFADRIGKGLRGAPRDALVADVTPERLRGAAFGLRQSLDTIGAFVGPLVAIGLMALLNGDMRAVFGYAVIPALIAVLLLVIGVEEPRAGHLPREARVSIRWSEVAGIGTAYWLALGVGVLFTLARFSEAFLVLKGTAAGLPATLAPLVLIVMNVVYALTSAPLGSLSDHVGRKPLLAAGLAVMVVADLALAWAPNLLGVFAGIALWGLHMGLTQGLLAALVADAAPARLRGTAFGLFNLASGAALLLASLGAGLLWARGGPSLTFVSGAGISLAALVGVLSLLKEAPRAGPSGAS